MALDSTIHSTVSPREKSMACARAERKLIYHCWLALRWMSWTLVGNPMGETSLSSQLTRYHHPTGQIATKTSRNVFCLVKSQSPGFGFAERFGPLLPPVQILQPYPNLRFDAKHPSIRVKNRVRSQRQHGSVRGAAGNRCPYRDRFTSMAMRADIPIKSACGEKSAPRNSTICTTARQSGGERTLPIHGPRRASDSIIRPPCPWTGLLDPH